jgi:hypothetical protein
MDPNEMRSFSNVRFPECVPTRYTLGMRGLLIALATIGFTTIGARCSLAEGDTQNDAWQMNREEWQNQVKSSRQRAEEMRRQRRTFVPQVPTAEELAEEASARAFKDNSLRPGDVISTNRGFFRYQGFPDGERKPEDFVRIR